MSAARRWEILGLDVWAWNVGRNRWGFRRLPGFLFWLNLGRLSVGFWRGLP